MDISPVRKSFEDVSEQALSMVGSWALDNVPNILDALDERQVVMDGQKQHMLQLGDQVYDLLGLPVIGQISKAHSDQLLADWTRANIRYVFAAYWYQVK